MHKLVKAIKSFSYCTLIGVQSLYASMMMTSEEINILKSVAPDNDIVDELPEVNDFGTFAATMPDVLFLSAILYFQPTHWTVWINDKIYTHDNLEDDFLKLINVTKYSVEVEIKGSQKSAIIKANQSLMTDGKHTIDGDARVQQAPPML